MTKFTRAGMILLSLAAASKTGDTVRLSGKLTTEAKGTDSTPPSEFMLWAYGEIETTKGTFNLTKENALSIVDNVKKRGIELAFDYEHATFETTNNGPVPAAGWHTLEARDDGLYCVNVQWTKTAYDLIANRELRYFSPAFTVNDDNEITGYYNTALTNLPATDNIKPLVASSRPLALDRRVLTGAQLSFDEMRRELSELISKQFEENYDCYVCEVYDDHCIFSKRGDLFKISYTVSDGNLALTGDAVEVRHTYEEISGGETMKTLLVTLGMKPEATEAEAVVTARDVMAGHSQLLTLTGTNSGAEALGVIQAWKANSDRLPEVEAEVAATKADAEAKTRDDLVTTGIRDGKIPPALETYWKSQPVEALSQYLDAVMPNPTAANKGTGTGTPGNPSAGRTVALSDSASHIAGLFGNKPDAVAAHAAARTGQ